MKKTFRVAVKGLIKRVPYFKEIYKQLDALEVPPGHFYSPIPALTDVKQREDDIFHKVVREIPGINLNEDNQLALLKLFKQYYDEQPFFDHKRENFRYHFDNNLYPYSDAIVFYCMIRHYKPARIIEVGGSGYSSCLILDTNERFMNNSVHAVCIEPYPQNITSLLSLDREPNFCLINRPVYDIELAFFEALGPNDILFVDSSHISKIGSDVNYLFFHVFPCLQSGVLIHIHDIFYPFEYPKEWVYHKRAWNEAYLLRAFLQYNDVFSIEFFNTFLQRFHRDIFSETLPLCLQGIHYDWNGPQIWYGGSIWIRKL
jgi:hypothetical protein